MIRYFLAKGDCAGEAVIVEGLDTVTCSDPPPRVHIATLDMKTYWAVSRVKCNVLLTPRLPVPWPWLPRAFSNRASGEDVH